MFIVSLIAFAKGVRRTRKADDALANLSKRNAGLRKLRGDLQPEETGAFTFAYVVRAVSPGSYVHPPAMVEDMYRPQLNARTATGRMEVTGRTP